MSNIEQNISGNNNIQVAGDLKTEKIVHRTNIIYDKEQYITEEQAYNIQEQIKMLATELPNKNSYGFAYNMLYKQFKITSYKMLPRDRYEDAMNWLHKQIAINRNKLKKHDPEKWRKEMYKSIHARSNELGIDVHSFATTVLNIKKPVSSLTELSDLRLKKLYTALFSIKK